MKRNKILLSSGIFPWLTLSEITNIAYENNFDGIELVPTRQVIKNIENVYPTNSLALKSIKGIHHSWRLDIGHDKQYGLPFLLIPFFILLRLIFFPKVMESRKYISHLSKILHLTVTVHNVSKEWILDENNEEFENGILYELIRKDAKREEVKEWGKKTNHYFVVDTRDDQSLAWAKKHRFSNFKEFWRWISLEKIKNIQLTLIGIRGISRILSKKRTLPEEEFLWLNRNGWQGSVTVEINPLSLFLISYGDFRGGLKRVVHFVDETLNKGKPWSCD